jgi:hypothetical protein
MMLTGVQNPETGVVEYVRDPESYPGWTVIEEGVAHPRGHCRRTDKGWEPDREKHAERVVTMTAVEAEELSARIAAVEERLAAIEKAQGKDQKAG